MTRNEEYLNTIITALGGDPSKIPPYTFESEDNLAYLAKAFEGVTPGGGGSSGGGVLVIHETVEGTTHTLDKTWQEIHDFDGISVVTTDDDTGRHFNIVSGISQEELPDLTIYGLYSGEQEYSTNSASGYPSSTVE